MESSGLICPGTIERIAVFMKLRASTAQSVPRLWINLSETFHVHYGVSQVSLIEGSCDLDLSRDCQSTAEYYRVCANLCFFSRNQREIEAAI